MNSEFQELKCLYLLAAEIGERSELGPFKKTREF
jgi:hypothetical protein